MSKTRGETSYGEVVFQNITYFELTFLRIFLYDGQIFESTYQILVATNWKQNTGPHKLVRGARRFSEVIRQLYLQSKQGFSWISKISKSSTRRTKEKAHFYFLFLKKTLCNLSFPFANFQDTRKRAEDPESQCCGLPEPVPETVRRIEPIEVQNLIRGIENAIDEIVNPVLKTFKEESTLKKRVGDLFGKWKARE